MPTLKLKNLIGKRLYESIIKENIDIYLDFFNEHTPLHTDYQNFLRGDLNTEELKTKINTSIRYDMSIVHDFEREKFESLREDQLMNTENLQKILDKFKIGEDILRRILVKDVIIKETANIIGNIPQDRDSEESYIQCLIKKLPPFYPASEKTKENDLWILINCQAKRINGPSYATWLTRTLSQENVPPTLVVHPKIIVRGLMNSVEPQHQQGINHQDPN